ncbi:MAG: galactan 5-O-arabinofuranosyltransferase [Corynebacterium camporealensis]|uniref:galactan 5-O-arabinofuranosyltransferase n=1 Tax=Corynebacterium camporealensis TaxID=161896 RepID=UPI002A91D904|nr:galactan 5-O-arabinofuranosyltransferase [Corynebacterium camporealensis]MDY5840872.1 galactan 5-O-arabinofuranosyltransferase [Corynebacterium camporealensis]
MTSTAYQSPIRADLTTEYKVDRLPRTQALLGIGAAALGGGFITVLGWLVFRSVDLPAFSTSLVTRALATLGIVLTMLVVGVLAIFWLRDSYPDAKPRPKWRTWLTYAFTYMSPALLVLASVGIPLSATRLWLDGIQVDQTFRTQFLTRTTESASYADMNYEGMPTFYPLGWFWLGGRMANLLGVPGWEGYQPWALVSIAVAGCILVPLWQHLTGSLPVATAIALTTTAVTLTLAAEEPYSAVIAMGVPAIAVLCAHAFTGSRFAMLGITLYLGISATFYTLFTGAVSLLVVSLIAIVMALFDRDWRPVLRLVIVGMGSLAIAAIAWAPYLIEAIRHHAPLQSVAQHFLPKEGTQLPVPFLSVSVIGLLCLIGLIYLVLRWQDGEVRALGFSVIGIYIWIVTSMAMTLAGTTLLGFRLEVIVVLQLATAGILALAELRLVGIEKLYPDRFSNRLNKQITVVLVMVLSLGGIYYAQQIPAANEEAIDHAYMDTDGYGERGDRYTSDSSRDYLDIRAAIDAAGYEPTETTVLTDEHLFMAYNPYWGFNAFTSHYANPLGEFTTRNEQIRTWAADSWEQTPEEFSEALDSTQWNGPDVLLFRGDVEDPGDGFKLHLAEDIYPNHPNVRYTAVFFNPEVFEEGFTLEQVGPFVLAIRDK